MAFATVDAMAARLNLLGLKVKINVSDDSLRYIVSSSLSHLKTKVNAGVGSVRLRGWGEKKCARCGP